MRNILLIAKREYLEQIRGRAFKISTVLVPLLIAALLGASYFTNRNATAGKHMAIAAGSAPLANDIRRWLLDDKDAKFTVDVVAPATPQDRDALLKLVQSRAIDGLLWVESSPAGAPVATYTSHSSVDFTTTSRLKYALNRALLNERLTATGMKPAEADALLKEVSIETLQVNKEGKATKSNRMASFSKAIAIAFLLTMPILLYGLDAARSIIEEKTSRIFEVMLAVVRPDDLLAGKLIGVGAVGLTQIAIWVIAAALLTGSALAAPLLSRQCRLPFLLDRGPSLSAVLCAGFLPLQRVLFRPGGHLRDGAGVADVYAAGCRSSLAQLRHHTLSAQQSRFGLVRCRIALSTHCALRHASADRFGDPAAVAVCGFHRPPDSEHLGRALVLIAPLPRGYPDVWQAGHAARAAALDAL